MGQQLVSYKGRLLCGSHRWIVEPYANCKVLVLWPCYSNSVPGNAKEYYKAQKVSSSSFAGSTRLNPAPLGRRTLKSDSLDSQSKLRTHRLILKTANATPETSFVTFGVNLIQSRFMRSKLFRRRPNHTGWRSYRIKLKRFTEVDCRHGRLFP